jgi:predicted nuclease with TOPRIM domain
MEVGGFWEMKVVLGKADGKDFELDFQELITGRIFLSSVSRYGKSWTARRIVEQVFGKAGIVIVDPEGEYSTLRDMFPFLIIGKDVPVVPEAAEYLADQILEHDLSVIVDLSDPRLEVLTGQEFVSRLIDRFINLETEMKKPYLWVLEEADEFAPEKGTFKSASLQSVIKLAKKGGKRGLGLIAITQRPAFLSKYVVSQCTNQIVGRIEWPDDIAVIKKFLRIPEEVAQKLKEVEKGTFYVRGDFAKTEGFVKVGPVKTKHLGATPEVVPPAPTELKDVLSKMRESLPKIVEEKLAPAIPKVAEIEARLKAKFEAAWQARLQRVEKERDAIKRRLEAKYEAEIADLRRKYEEAVRQATLKGGVADLLSHPLVQKNLEKLNDKQRSLVQMLETKGPQDADRIAFFLEIAPRSVPNFIHKINEKIPGLIENVQGKYVSRLAKLFPVTEELQAEVKESERLKKELDGLKDKLASKMSEAEQLRFTLKAYVEEKERLANEVNVLKIRVKELEEKLREKEVAKPIITPTEPTVGPGISGQSVTVAPQAQPAHVPGVTEPSTTVPQVQLTVGPPAEQVVPVEVRLKRVVTDVNVITSKEVLEADETTPMGKILARGLDGFFDQPKTFGNIMKELERKYAVSPTSGGSKQAVMKALEELVSKGILDRREEGKQWVYFSTPEFRKRVREK